MRFDQFYAAAAAQPQAAAPVSPANDSAPKPVARTSAANATTVSWIGVLLALVALRVIYELSE